MALRTNYSNIDLLRFKRFADKNTELKPIELLQKFNDEYPELSEKQKLANLYAALGMNDEHKKLTGEDIPESARWIHDETSQDQSLNLACVSGSLPEVTLMNEQKLGDTFINWKELSPEKQWQRIDAMLHEIGLKVVRQ